MRVKWNIWDVIDKIEEWWPWHDQSTDDKDFNPDLNPVLLVPGIGGSILNAVDEKGKKERIWVRLFAADHEFRAKLWSFYNPETGKTESLDPTIQIEVPDDRFGLYGCDILDPDIILRLDVVYYFHDLIKQLLSWGYSEGTTLFGFPYDFRQSNRLPERMQEFETKLKQMYEASGGKKVDIVSHSMGGLIVKNFLALHPEVFEKYVNKWIAVTVPFQGAPGFIMDCLLTGVEFVKGWQRELFIAKWSMHQLLIECPSVYELMASPHFEWNDVPELRLWHQRVGGNGESECEMEVFGPKDCIGVMMAALKDNMLEYNGEQVNVPLNRDIMAWAMETFRIQKTAKLPKSVTFYNVFGTELLTPMHVCYGSQESPIQMLQDILRTEADYEFANGDGTVPAESAMADELDAKARIGIPGEHRGILNDDRFFRIMKSWLGCDTDPFYDPLNDYVILPTKAEFEEHKRQRIMISTEGDDTEDLVTDFDENEDYVMDMEKEYIATISSRTSDTRAEAHAHVTRSRLSVAEKKDCIEIDTVGVAEGADAKKTATALDQAMAAASEEAIAANTRGKRATIIAR
ncbi:phospholipase A1 [Marchantia polymorpha subsp. ruderalis]|uniref:Uncharacterized protein n=1 Tax=Marchantia polymorpha TaxID=3197 RepID=A0A2R6W855_MARPO|nr:hypothetical protein MARPO_0131s0029 [Marchantia polymorpha]BBN20393.1 hypothetical protein Mp_8g18740 [Marchantia polymorpha subsp. ruderalis]|eukprot:PTQ30035.1 hypothetical protein MARPO_0131s0029 [Marchantia polymorpha]